MGVASMIRISDAERFTNCSAFSLSKINLSTLDACRHWIIDLLHDNFRNEIPEFRDKISEQILRPICKISQKILRRFWPKFWNCSRFVIVQ